MNERSADEVYREVIDEIVDDCRNGQGQISPRRARAGLWNANATPEFAPEQHAVNQLLRSMSAGDREILATLLTQAFEGGAFAAITALHKVGVPPFRESYEGTPFNDFVGRLHGWEWPSRPRTP